MILVSVQWHLSVLGEEGCRKGRAKVPPQEFQFESRIACLEVRYPPSGVNDMSPTIGFLPGELVFLDFVDVGVCKVYRHVMGSEGEPKFIQARPFMPL
jgi:hypothetical protein